MTGTSETCLGHAADIDPVHVGQSQVEEDHLAGWGVECGGAGTDPVRRESVPGQAVPQGFGDGDIVLDQQHLHS